MERDIELRCLAKLIPELCRVLGKPVLDHLLVGDDTTMVLKVRQTKGLDTRITSCLAHDGSGDQSQELIDENGCSVDDDIMPPLRRVVAVVVVV